MQRILMIICLCVITGMLTGCGIFCPPRHEVLVIGQTGQNYSEEIPLVSNPDPETVSNTFSTVTEIQTYIPRTYVMVGYPAFYTGWYPYWGYHHRPFLSFGYYHHPYRRHHFHRPPPPHRWHGGRPHGGHHGNHRPFKRHSRPR